MPGLLSELSKFRNLFGIVRPIGIFPIFDAFLGMVRQGVR
jgi:hypothetical protein